MTITFNKKTDKIAIIAPASSSKDAAEKLEAGIKLLEDQGFHCIYNKDIFANDSVKYFAANKETRLQGLKEALENSEVKIIWAFRGGYGSSEIAYDLIGIKPTGDKILIGFSDITVFHSLFNKSYNLPTIHGSVLTSLLDLQKKMFPEIINVLQGNDTKLPLTAINDITSKHKSISGNVTGGNLTVFCHLIGTKLAPETSGKILIFEEAQEKGYQVHRYLMHLKNANLLDQVKAIIFADFTKSDEYLEDSIKHFTTTYVTNIPVFRLAGVGHGNINHPIVFGSNAVIEDDNLTITSPFKLI
ncbi:MAG: LD-carboxypeptidase [Rickettsiaceae bacterium]|nr:LD-carboxypeptidase [Rickettsiaceae bacterium]